MAFHRKPDEPAPPLVDTEVWVCSETDCKGWMRIDFSFADNPECPLCNGEMNTEVRQLQKIENR